MSEEIACWVVCVLVCASTHKGQTHVRKGSCFWVLKKKSCQEEVEPSGWPRRARLLLTGSMQGPGPACIFLGSTQDPPPHASGRSGGKGWTRQATSVACIEATGIGLRYSTQAMTQERAPHPLQGRPGNRVQGPPPGMWPSQVFIVLTD